MRTFKKIYIEITNICNLSCDFCPKTSRKPMSMSASNFEKIAKKIRPYGRFLYLHVKGEPTLHGEFEEILSICEKLDYRVCITTNGTLLKQKSDIILKSKAVHKVHISLHSFEASEINLSLSEYIESIVSLIQKASFITVLRLWNDGGKNELNDTIIEKLREKFEFLRDDKINKNTYIEHGEKFEWADTSSEISKETGFCYGLRDQIGVLVDGTVVPCCLDNNGDINLGNIYTQEVEEILQGERATNLYNNFSNRKFSEKLCTSCGFINRF